MTPRNMHPYVWRKQRLCYGLLAMSLFVLFTGIPLRGYAVTCASLGISLICVSALLARRRTIRRRMFEVSMELCPKCAYPLTGLAESGACPECGTPFSKPEVRGLWKRWANV